MSKEKIEISPDEIKSMIEEERPKDVDGEDNDKRIKIEKNQIFDAKSSMDMFNEALVDVTDIEVSESERENFLKSVLFDTPITFEISLMGGNLKVLIRSRSVDENQRVLNLLEKKLADGSTDLNTPDKYFLALQRLHASLAIQKINGERFSKWEDDSWNEEDLDKFVIENFQKSKSASRWMILINSLRVFEAKHAKLAEECVNEDFWKPQDTD